jgi:hypothetical protein
MFAGRPKSWDEDAEFLTSAFLEQFNLEGSLEIWTKTQQTLQTFEDPKTGLAAKEAFFRQEKLAGMPTHRCSLCNATPRSEFKPASVFDGSQPTQADSHDCPRIYSATDESPTASTVIATKLAAVPFDTQPQVPSNTSGIIDPGGDLPTVEVDIYQTSSEPAKLAEFHRGEMGSIRCLKPYLINARLFQGSDADQHAR